MICRKGALHVYRRSLCTSWDSFLRRLPDISGVWRGLLIPSTEVRGELSDAEKSILQRLLTTALLSATVHSSTTTKLVKKEPDGGTD